MLGIVKIRWIFKPIYSIIVIYVQNLGQFTPLYGRKDDCMSERTKPCIPEVSVSQDMMTVKLRLNLKNDGPQFDLAELKELLRSHDVKAGIMDEAIEEMIAHDIYGAFVDVARGKQPEKGQDGSYVFHFENASDETGPKELEDGSVEYIHTKEYTIVEEGELLAEYVPATNGVYGYTVGNQMLSPLRGKELPPLRCKGVRREENKYFALCHGKAEYTDSGIYVTNVLEIKGDADISVGHINFDGDVLITGDVKSGITVKATGNIEIRGHVGNSIVEAGKDITIHNGMQGKFSGRLQAGGDISCKFFENAQATAAGNINVRTVMNSNLETEGKVIVEGKESVVLGGSIYAVQGIDASEVGNEMEIETVLVAGTLPKMLRRDMELAQLIKKTEGEVDLLDRSAKILNRMEQTKVAKETNNRKLKIIQAKVIKTTELKKYQEEKIRSEALIDSGKNAEIVVHKVIYPGCVIEIAGNRLLLKDSLRRSKFVLRDGSVRAILL